MFPVNLGVMLVNFFFITYTSGFAASACGGRARLRRLMRGFAALCRAFRLRGFAASRLWQSRAAPTALDTRLRRASSPHLSASPRRACGAL